MGGEVALHVHTHVREDLIALYGFLRSREKQLFEKLITVSGIGPKLAITILSGMAADEMVGAIRGNDIARLTRIPGIGKKTAERMVLELRDKLPVESAGEVTTSPAMSAVDEDVLSALLNLGYPRATAEKALAALAEKREERVLRGPVPGSARVAFQLRGTGTDRSPDWDPSVSGTETSLFSNPRGGEYKVAKGTADSRFSAGSMAARVRSGCPACWECFFC